jgi:hypothetical protein
VENVVLPQQVKHPRQQLKWTLAKQREFFDEIRKKLDVKEPSDWYKVRKSQICKLGGSKFAFWQRKTCFNIQTKALLSSRITTMVPQHKLFATYTQSISGKTGDSIGHRRASGVPKT